MATALQKARTVALYRDSLKTLLSWAVARDIFYVKVRLRYTHLQEHHEE